MDSRREREPERCHARRLATRSSDFPYASTSTWTPCGSDSII